MKTKGKHHDLQNLFELVGQDQQALERMLGIFLESTPEILQDLNAAFQASDWEELGKQAHKLKSSIDLLMITELSTDIRLIEKKSKSVEDVESIPPYIDKLNAILKEVFEELK